MVLCWPNNYPQQAYPTDLILTSDSPVFSWSSRPKCPRAHVFSPTEMFPIYERSVYQAFSALSLLVAVLLAC
jgi:hypothetical protein